MPTNNNPLVLDTHVLIWSMSASDELSRSTQELISMAQDMNLLFVNSISLWEIAMLMDKQRLNAQASVDDFLESIVKMDGVSIKDISHRIASESLSLSNNFHNDPAGRLIAATAKVHNATLATRDRAIIKCAKNSGIKILEV